jgi:hypothetical protein
MVGSLYRDDKDFIANFLYSSVEIQIWIYLKLSTYEYVLEEDELKQIVLDEEGLYPYEIHSLSHLNDQLYP